MKKKKRTESFPAPMQEMGIETPYFLIITVLSIWFLVLSLVSSESKHIIPLDLCQLRSIDGKLY
jgi:hypothetical protein